MRLSGERGTLTVSSFVQQSLYKSGVMYALDGNETKLNDTSLGITEGRILWNLARQSKPGTIIETGFGRGGSAAFFLSALAPWGGKLISIDPAFRHWAGDVGINYLRHLGIADNHTLIERPSELALAQIVSDGTVNDLKLSYIDGSHHFDGTLIDFVYLDRLTAVDGIIAIDDAHSPAVRTVTSFVAHNFPYQIFYPTERLVLLKKTAMDSCDWSHFKPFVSSPRSDWDVHPDRPDALTVPAAKFGY